MVLDVIAVLAYYAFALFGAVALGYGVLWFTRPSFRASARDEKLGRAGVTGGGLVVAALAVDALVSGTGAVLQARGVFPLLLLALAALAFVALRALGSGTSKPVEEARDGEAAGAAREETEFKVEVIKGGGEKQAGREAPASEARQQTQAPKPPESKARESKKPSAPDSGDMREMTSLIESIGESGEEK